VGRTWPTRPSPSTPQSGRRLRHGFHNTTCSLARERPCTQLSAVGLSTKLSNIHRRAGNFILSRKNQVFGNNRVVHTGLPYGEQVFTHCNLSCSSQSSRSRGTHVLPDQELRSYFSSSVCSGHPMGRSMAYGMTARTAELHSLSVKALGGPLTRGSCLRIFLDCSTPCSGEDFLLPLGIDLHDERGQHSPRLKPSAIKTPGDASWPSPSPRKFVPVVLTTGPAGVLSSGRVGGGRWGPSP
jgi:hypothetical protein